MTRSDWITIAVIALGALILIRFYSLKIWVFFLVFGGGFYFATTPAGQFLLSHATSFITSLTH